MRTWLRRLHPWTGLPYRLMDSGVAIGWIAFFWYIATDASSSTTAALGQGLLILVGPMTWGLLLFAASVYAVVVSGMGHGALRSGYVVLFIACLGWAASLLLGVIVANIVSDIEWQETGKTLGSAMWFFYAASNLLSRAAEARDRQTLADAVAEASEGDRE